MYRVQLKLLCTPPPTRLASADALIRFEAAPAEDPAAGGGSASDSRPFVEVLSPGDAIDSPGDRKLRFVRRVLFLARRWKQQMDNALRHHGSSHARWLTLTWVDLLDGQANHRELAERVNVELPTLVRLLNRLEQENLVQRRSLGGKGRAKSVVLTDSGREALARMAVVVNETRATFLQGIDDEQLSQALETLDQLLKACVPVIDWRVTPTRRDATDQPAAFSPNTNREYSR